MKLLPDIRSSKPLERYELIEQVVGLMTLDITHPNRGQTEDLADKFDFFGFGTPMDYEFNEIRTMQQACQSMMNVCERIIREWGSTRLSAGVLNHGGPYKTTPNKPLMGYEYQAQATRFVFKAAGMATLDDLNMQLASPSRQDQPTVAMAAIAIFRECVGFCMSSSLQMDADPDDTYRLHEDEPPQWGLDTAENLAIRDAKTKKLREDAGPPF